MLQVILEQCEGHCYVVIIIQLHQAKSLIATFSV